GGRGALCCILGGGGGGVVVVVHEAGGALGGNAALWRGAAATFVDSDERAVAAVRAKLETFGAVARVERSDAIAFLGGDQGAMYDLVFLDPPYDSAPELGEGLSELLPQAVAQDAVIVTESDKRAPLQLTLPLADERTSGDTRIATRRA